MFQRPAAGRCQRAARWHPEGGQALRRLSHSQRLQKVFEMNEFSRGLFKDNLHRTHGQLSDQAIHELLLLSHGFPAFEHPSLFRAGLTRDRR